MLRDNKRQWYVLSWFLKGKALEVFVKIALYVRLGVFADSLQLTLISRILGMVLSS
jgi:hypothetical protein